MAKPTTVTDARPKRRGFFSFLKLGLKWLGIAVLALVIVGYVYQLAATEIDRNNLPPPGILVDVEGHRMHILCTGQGSPTVILEAGGYSFSSEWSRVQEQASSTQKVCSYDRGGYGWSEPGPAPRTAQRIVGELHALLAAAKIPPPYILVGHSFGGILNTVYAAQYPDEVSGVVLVDTAYASAIHFANEDEYQQWKRDNDLLNAPLWAMIRTGIGRVMNASSFRDNGYSGQALDQLVAFRSTNQAFDTYYAEGIAVGWQNQAAFAAASVGSRPLMVLWATQLPRKLKPEEEAVLAALQQGVAALSSDSETRYLQGSDHGSIIGNEQYAQQVTAAIQDVSEAVRTGKLLSQP